MAKVSIIIPSRNEEFLEKTVNDIFKKAKGDFEVVVICDEKMQELKPRKNLFIYPKEGKPGLRSAINQGIRMSHGKYIMKTDGHCMFGEGFDVILAADMQDNWVVVPRRFSLIPEEWKVNPARPIIDYEYFVFPWVPEIRSVKTGGKWYQRAIDRKELLIDEDMAMQGSCWFTSRLHMEQIGGFDDSTTTGIEFVLESEELCNKTWLSGGKVMVNKKTWYAHLHKGSRGRGYFIDKRPFRKQRAFHTDYWMHNKWPKQIHKMEWLIEKFMPIPGWPEDWMDPKWEQQYIENNKLPQYWQSGYSFPIK